MVYGIKAARFRKRIVNSSVCTRQAVVLNGRASVSLECINSPNGECRSISYGFVKIQKSVGESSDLCYCKKEEREGMD